MMERKGDPFGVYPAGTRAGAGVRASSRSGGRHASAKSPTDQPDGRRRLKRNRFGYLVSPDQNLDV